MAHNLWVLVFVAYPKLRTMSKMPSRSRSRSQARALSRFISSPPTPKTPSEAFDSSGDEDEDELVMAFDCKVIMNSGKLLGSFRCDHHSSLGYVRSRVRQTITDMRNNGFLAEFDSFQLLRGEQICSNDTIKIFEMFTNCFGSENDCLLTVVIM